MKNTPNPARAKINHLSWKEASLASKLKLLFLTLKQSWPRITNKTDAEEKAEGYKALASTCINIAGTAIKSIRLHPITLLWIPLGGLCYLLMLPLAWKVYKLKGSRMTIDQADICQSAFLKWCLRKKAKRCIRIGLTNEAAKFHSYGLLHVALASILQKEGKYAMAKNEVEKAIGFAEQSEKQEPEQASRIYKHAANVLQNLGHDPQKVESFRIRGRELAKKNDTKDQLLKQK